MSILRDIQASLMEQGQSIGPILFKLRYLASRLGSDVLEEWVKFESEGYPELVELPEYRLVNVTYTIDALGPAGSGVRNAPVPAHIVEKHAGQKWVKFDVRQSVASIDFLMQAGSDAGSFLIDASNLPLLLQGKVYPQMNIAAAHGSISKAEFSEIQNAVRARILELTIQLEREIPYVVDIHLGPFSKASEIVSTDKVTKLTQNVINGNYLAIENSGDGNVLSICIAKDNREQLEKALLEAGLSKGDAKELSEIMQAESPAGKSEPFGSQAKSWVSKNVGKVADGSGKVAANVATKVLTEAALQYYGLK